jgi:drug/metabolite transporter (DMT)-like permease
VERGPAVTGRFYALGAGISYGTLGIFSKLFYDHGGTNFMLLVLRFCGGWTLFAGIMLLRRRPWPAWRDAALATALGAGQLAATFCLFVGFQHASPGLVALLFYIYPLLVTIGGKFVFGEQLGHRRAAVLAVGVIGITLTVGLPHSASALGIGCGLAAGLFATVYILGSRHVLSRTVDPVQYTTLAYTGGSAAMLIAFLIHGSDPTSGRALTYAVLVIIASTVIPSLLLYSAIRAIGAGPAARLATMEPVTAVVLSYVVLGESLGTGQIAGGVLVLASVALLAASPGTAGTPAIRPLAEP